MKILVIEDKENHANAAREQLANHEVTVCTSYQSAEKILSGGDGEHYYRENGDLLYIEKAEFPFDVVLTDLFLPPCSKGIGTHSDAEVPYGLVFAMVAMRRGVPVAIVSDKSHHDNPISWALDLLEYNSMKKINLGKSVFSSCSATTDNGDGERVKDWKKALGILKN